MGFINEKREREHFFGGRGMIAVTSTLVIVVFLIMSSFWVGN